MRLTLRTLLGWIDGVLPPEEHQLIGGMVAGSKVATHLAERIREGAACGGTEVPLTGGPAIADDPNRVAEYLDNTLLSEHLAAFERLCIESRPHLEEVATCHGMLAEMYRAPKPVRMPSEQRSVLRQRIRRSMNSLAVASHVAAVNRSEEVSGQAVPAETPAVASNGHVGARAAADALVQAMLSKPSRRLEPVRPLEPVRRDDERQSPLATLTRFLPSWRRPAESGANKRAANGSTAVASAPEPEEWQAAAVFADPVISPAEAPVAATRSKSPSLAAWVTAALALVVLLAAGGALMSPLRGAKTYAPEPGCMHCTRP